MSEPIDSQNFKKFTDANLKRKLAEWYTAIHNISLKNSIEADLTGLKILDLGSGNGELCREYETYGAAKVIGVDISPEMLQNCVSTEKTSFVQADVFHSESLELILNEHMGTFDGISAIWTLAFAPSTEKLEELFKFVKKALAPNGVFVAVVSNPAIITDAANIVANADIKNYEIALVNDETDFGLMRTTFFDLETRETLARFENKCFKIHTMLHAFDKAGLRVVKQGALDIDPQYANYGYDLERFRNYLRNHGCVMCYSALNN